MICEFTLPLDPIPCPRARVRTRPFATTYYPAKYQDWQKDAAKLLAQVEAPSDIPSGPLRVRTEFIINKPKTTKFTFPRGDIDNYEKSIYDAITKDGRFWNDDVDIQKAISSKRFARPDEGPSIRVAIYKADLSD